MKVCRVIDEQTGRMDRGTDGLKDRGTDERTDGLTDGLTVGGTDRLTDEQKQNDKMTKEQHGR